MPVALSDHPIRPHQHIRRNRQADFLCRFQIDDEFELLWLLNREIGGLSAFEDLVHVSSGALCSLRIEDKRRQHEDYVSTLFAGGSECGLNILAV